MRHKLTQLPRNLEVTDYSLYCPGSFIFLDFSFYNVVSIRGFSSVIDIICASTRYSFSFPTRPKRVPLDILKWLFAILNKENKTVRIIRVDEDGALARSREFCKLVQLQNISLQTTGGYMSSLNGMIERPHRDAHKATRINIGSNIHLPENLWYYVRTYWKYIFFLILT